MPQVSVRPAHAPQQPPAASLSEPPSCPPAVPAATGQLSRSRMRPPAVAARTVCGLGGWCVRRGPRGPQLPPRAARRKVRGSPVTARTRRPMSLSRRRRRSLVAPSARRRYQHCAARDGRRRHGRDGPPLRPRRHRQRRRHRPFRWYHSCPMWCARCDRARLHTAGAVAAPRCNGRRRGCRCVWQCGRCVRDARGRGHCIRGGRRGASAVSRAHAWCSLALSRSEKVIRRNGAFFVRDRRLNLRIPASPL